MNNARCLLLDERGLTAIEYSLVSALVSLSILAGLLILNVALPDLFGRVANSVNNNTP